MTDRAMTQRHWLYRPHNWPRLWKWGGVILLFTVIAELFVDMKPKFGFADWFAFYAVFGFVSCLVMVVFAKWLGNWVKRPEDYYDGSGQPMEAAGPAPELPPESAPELPPASLSKPGTDKEAGSGRPRGRS